MKIKMPNSQAFLTELSRESQNVWDSTVRVAIERSDLNGDSLLWSVSFVATAVILKDAGEYLIEYEQHAGIDEPGIQDSTGSDAAEALSQQIAEQCGRLKLELQAGRIVME